MKNLIITGVILSFSLLFSSCDKDAEGKMFDSSLIDANSLTFQVEEGTYSIQPEGTGEIVIPVYRLNATGAFSTEVNVEVSDETVFSVESNSISFTGGETMTSIVINYDYDEMAFFKDYEISVTIPGEAGVYLEESYTVEGETEVELSSLIVSTSLLVDKALTWSPYGEVHWVSEFWGEEGVRNIWKSDQADAYRVENIFFIENGPTFEFVVDDEGNISAAEFQPVWYNTDYEDWVGAMEVSGYKEGNTFYVSVGSYYILGLGGWAGPWAETGTLIMD